MVVQRLIAMLCVVLLWIKCLLNFEFFLREFYIAVKKLSILQTFVFNGLVTYLLGFEFKFGVLIYHKVASIDACL